MGDMISKQAAIQVVFDWEQGKISGTIADAIAALPPAQPDAVQALVAKAVAQERERCISRVRDNWVAGAKTTLGEVLAAIRAGGKP